MKVLKHGNYYRENKIIECICGCKFEYDNEDIKTDLNLIYTTNPPQYQQFVLCPECNSRNDLSKTFLSQPVKLS